MKGRFSLSFPYLCAIAVVALIVWEQFRGGEHTPDPNAMAGTGETVHTDLVCNMEIGMEISAKVDGTNYYFCADRCRDLFLEDSGKYLTVSCLVCRVEGTYTPVESGLFDATWQGVSYPLCSELHREAFRADPAGYFLHTMWGIPNWLYYASVALVLVLSFGLFEIRAKRKTTSPFAAQRPRIDLTRLPLVKPLLRHKATRPIIRLAFAVMFVVVVAAGLFGNQLPSKNIAPILTWTVWWGGLVILILYAGKAWCYVCPWEAIADWAEALRFWGPKKEGLTLGLRWPKVMRNIWPATFFFVALTWIEIGFGVTMNPRATAWLALSMVLMAFVCAFIFDRKSFCRYGCLVGRVSGLYALFSPVEVRARDKQICRSCDSKACYKGSDTGEPCPTFQYLPGMQQNTYCISCMECLKTCDQDNVAVQLRPWGEDLVARHRPRTDEAYLALLMLSLTGFHGLTMTAVWRDFQESIQRVTGAGHMLSFSLGMTVLMFAPGVLYALLVAISHRLGNDPSLLYRDYFIRYAYALLPIALFYHLAHNSEHLFMEGQKIITLVSDPFGWDWNLFNTSNWTVAPLLSLSTLWVLQVGLVLIGHVYSLWIARAVAGNLFTNSRAVFRSQIPMLAAMILFSLMSLWLLKQPMEMRVSAM